MASAGSRLASLMSAALRFGFIANFLSRPVLTGYLCGVSLSLLAGQIERLTKVRIEHGGFLRPVGELITQWKIIWPRMVDDVLKRRFIQVGLFAWIILLALAVTSPAFVLRAMGGKNWQRLHRLIYVAAIAGIIHYWWQVKKGNLAPWKDTVVLTILLLARVLYNAIKARRSKTLVTTG